MFGVGVVLVVVHFERYPLGVQVRGQSPGLTVGMLIRFRKIQVRRGLGCQHGIDLGCVFIASVAIREVEMVNASTALQHAPRWVGVDVALYQEHRVVALSVASDVKNLAGVSVEDLGHFVYWNDITDSCVGNIVKQARLWIVRLDGVDSVVVQVFDDEQLICEFCRCRALSERCLRGTGIVSR